MSRVRRPRRSGRRPAEDELLGLDEELDLADAATPELDVVPGHCDLGMAAHRLDLTLHGMNIRRWRRSRNTCAR